ncbi:MAG: hypothetical protein ACK2UV_11320 [Candidatus Promineifilaceae bacterium]|jgi:hypothetical protein
MVMLRTTHFRGLYLPSTSVRRSASSETAVFSSALCAQEGKFALRMAISSFRIYLSDIDHALDVLKWTAEKLIDEE